MCTHAFASRNTQHLVPERTNISPQNYCATQNTKALPITAMLSLLVFKFTSSQEVTFFYFFLGSNIFQYLNLARGLSKRAPQQRLTKILNLLVPINPIFKELLTN